MQHSKSASTCSPKTCTRMFQAASVARAKRQKPHKCPSAGEQGDRGWHVHASEQHRTPPPAVSHLPRCSVPPPPPTDITTGRRTRREEPRPDDLLVIRFGNGYNQPPVQRPEDGSFLGERDGGAGSVLDLALGGDYRGGTWRKMHHILHFQCTLYAHKHAYVTYS